MSNIEVEATTSRIITAIKPGGKSGSERSHIYINGRFAFSLENEVVIKEKLKEGQVLSVDKIKRLNQSDSYLRCLNAAYQFLSARPRSQSEISQRLAKRGFAPSEIEQTIVKLKELNLVNDTAFAEYWTENRTAFRPRSRQMLKMELQEKGLETEIVNQTVSSIDETTGAYKAAVERAKRMKETDYLEFRRKLGGFLQRRGYGYGVINSTIKRVWQEIKGNSGDLPIDFNQGE